MNISVGPSVSEDDCSIFFDVGKGVKDMGKFVRWDVVGEELARIDVPIAKVTDGSVAITGCYSCRLCPRSGGGNDDRLR